MARPCAIWTWGGVTGCQFVQMDYLITYRPCCFHLLLQILRKTYHHHHQFLLSQRRSSNWVFCSACTSCCERDVVIFRVTCIEEKCLISRKLTLFATSKYWYEIKRFFYSIINILLNGCADKQLLCCVDFDVYYGPACMLGIF